jgi:succinate dehydrogenase / fumarate reductase flavoprotein subunit
MNNNGTHSVDYFHRKLGIMWDKVGMARNAEGLNQAIVEIAALRGLQRRKVSTDKGFNQELEKQPCC